jgi:hypothetical protein
MKREGDIGVYVQHTTELDVSAEMVSLGIRRNQTGGSIAVVCHAADDDDIIDLVEDGVTLFKGTKKELREWIKKHETK